MEKTKYKNGILIGGQLSKERQMQKYIFDWKDIIYGSIEIEAENGLDAENQLMNMSLKELLEKSSTGSDNFDREIRFVNAGQYFESISAEEWNEQKRYL